MAEATCPATWTTSRRGGGLGKNKHCCHDENHRAGGGWVFFKRLHVKCGLRDFWEVAWVAGWVLGSGSGRAAQKQDLDCFSSCFAVLVFEFSLESQNSEACELSQLWLPLLDFAL